MGFKENIKNRRLELNFTLEQLADILGINPSWLMGWSDIKFTKKENDLLVKYNSLGKMGKHTIDVVLEIEFNRCNK